MACPSEVAGFEFNVSESVTFALSTQIIQQRNNFDPTVFADQRQAKIDVVALRRQRQASLVSQIAPLLPPNLQRILTLSSEKGASSWLSVLPIEDHGFALHKGAFCDTLCLHYGWLPHPSVFVGVDLLLTML